MPRLRARRSVEEQLQGEGRDEHSGAGQRTGPARTGGHRHPGPSRSAAGGRAAAVAARRPDGADPLRGPAVAGVRQRAAAELGHAGPAGPGRRRCGGRPWTRRTQQPGSTTGTASSAASTTAPATCAPSSRSRTSTRPGNGTAPACTGTPTARSPAGSACPKERCARTCRTSTRG
jgi:hypothetical protein